MPGRHKRNSVKPLTRKIVCDLLRLNPAQFPSGAEIFRRVPSLKSSEGTVYRYLRELRKLPVETFIDVEPGAKRARSRRPSRDREETAPEDHRFKSLEESFRENLDDIEDFLDVIRVEAQASAKVDARAYCDLVRMKRDICRWIQDETAPEDTGQPELMPMEQVIRRAELRKKPA